MRFGYSAAAVGLIDSLIAAVNTPIGRFLSVVQDLFEKDLPGRWLDHDELITTLKHLLEFKEQKRSSPFWHEQEYSFWVDVHGRGD